MKRLAEEYKHFQRQKKFHVHIPDKQHMDIWHITVPGTPDTPFGGGRYHFKFTLDEYPDGPPDIQVLNPNGSFKPGMNICIEGFSKHHRDKWKTVPVITMAETLQTMMQFRDEDIKYGIGIIPELVPETIKKHAQDSLNFVCNECGKTLGQFIMVV